MQKWQKQLVIIGGGPAGLAAACAANDEGLKDILILERDHELGGILNQCIHNGFGLHYFKEELTGPEYAERFIDEVKKREIPYLTDCMVISLSRDKKIIIASKKHGLVEIDAKAVILAMGCRERTRAAITIPGTRPSGVYTAGTVQQMVNIEGLLPGKKVVIVGSGDIGLIMARRLFLEGAEVLGVVEIMAQPGGLHRNIAQCLEDFGIPLYLSHTVALIEGKDRVESVLVAPVDKDKRPILNKAFSLKCDTLVLSVGLIPENELSKEAEVALDPVTNGPVVTEALQTEIPGIFACGNVLQVHDLVDNVTNESLRAGKMAARFVKEGNLPKCLIKTKSGENVRYVVPQKISTSLGVEFFLRAQKTIPNATLVVGEGFLKRRLREAKPSEMISVKIPREKLRDLQDKTLTFSLLEGSK